MTFTATDLPGVLLLKPDIERDARGFFARTFCAHEFAQKGLNSCIKQCSVSSNSHKATIRGLHYQAPPHGEVKIVRCTQGSVYDVVLDLRPSSPTYAKWTAAELSRCNHQALYIPSGCAHGFQTLEDDTEVFYQMSVEYHPESARGVRWDDSLFQIHWPLPPSLVSARDRSFPDFRMPDDTARGSSQ